MKIVHNIKMIHINQYISRYTYYKIIIDTYKYTAVYNLKLTVDNKPTWDN